LSAVLHARLAGLYPGQWDRRYVPAKLKSDPLYRAVHEELCGSELPLLDLGCGLGLLAFYLREKGLHFPIHGLDYDSRKIEGACLAADKGGYEAVAFDHHDARKGLPGHSGNVTILDILQFFDPAQQETLLQLAADRVASGGKLIIRSGLRDDSWRFKITVAGDWLAKATLWMKAAPTHYPSADDFQRILSPYGHVRIEPLWGGTPFNNHRIVLERS
jgi:2-polyprenyl-3-methyl-5-hydroxy-6-metoxy-1,4-benzoquinol methylase